MKVFLSLLLKTSALIVSSVLLCACGGGSDSSPSLEESDTSGLLIPIEGDAELLSNIQSGMDQTASVSRERFDGDAIFLGDSVPMESGASSAL